ncbi:MAG: HD domain-containing phosphohydrolase [Planctomycetota bacterium]
MALLRIASGENKEKIYPLGSEKLVMGRDCEEIPILDQGVSRQHAEIFRIDEMYFIRDLESRNGTFVNENRIDDSWLLRTGDRIHVGNTVLIFEDRFARPRDSRIVRFGDTADTPGSTVSIKLGTGLGEPAASAEQDEEHVRLKVLYKISRYLGTGEDLNQTMQEIAREMSHALNADHVYLFAFDTEHEDQDEEFRLVAAYDRRPVDDLSVSRSTLRRVRSEGRPILSSDAMLDERFSAQQSIVVKKIKSLLSVPLLVMNKPVGAFYASNSKLSEAFSAEDLELATTIGMLVGNALEMWEVLERQGSLYRNVLKTLSEVAEMRTPELRGRSERVAMYSAAMARALGYSDHKTRLLWIAGLLHDIGAIALTEEELKNALNLEQRKAKLTSDLLGKLPELSEVAPAIRHHSERTDGSGFPQGLSDNDIPLEAQIVGIACIFDDLLTHGGDEGQELSTKEALIRVRDLAEKKFSVPVINSLLIAYRRGMLFKEDTHLFTRGI